MSDPRQDLALLVVQCLIQCARQPFEHRVHDGFFGSRPRACAYHFFRTAGRERPSAKGIMKSSDVFWQVVYAHLARHSAHRVAARPPDNWQATAAAESSPV